MPTVRVRFLGISSSPFARAKIAFSLIVTLFGFGERAVAEDGDQIYRTAVKHLLSDSSQIRAESEATILKERKMVVQELGSLIRDRNNRLLRPDAVRRAVHIRGEMGTVEGIDVLVEYIRIEV